MKIFNNKLYTCTFLATLFFACNFIDFNGINLPHENTSTDAITTDMIDERMTEDKAEEDDNFEVNAKVSKTSIGVACISCKIDKELLSYEAIERKICRECGEDITDDYEKHFENSDGCRDFYTTLFYVQVGLKEEGSDINEK